MTKLPQVSHERVVRALKRAGFYIFRKGKHISMTDDKHLVIIPRHHVIKPGTLKQILDAADISPETIQRPALMNVPLHAFPLALSSTGTNCPRPKWEEWPRTGTVSTQQQTSLTHRNAHHRDRQGLV